MSLFRGLRAALAFLTRIPVGSRPFTAGELSWAPAWFPVVGALLGALTSAVFTLLDPLGSLAAATVATGASIWLTGALHEDGLADTLDAIGGAVARTRALEIMKDSRIGSYGALGLFIVITARIAMLVRIGGPAFAALVLSGGLGRLAPLLLMTHLHHASPREFKLPEFLATPRSRAWVGVMLIAPLTGAFLIREPIAPLRLLAALVVVPLFAYGSARIAVRRLGGYTGDLLGASEQLTELAILGVFAWKG